MENQDNRLQSNAPLWGHWASEKRIYCSGSCSVYMLSGGQREQGFCCVLKQMELEEAGK